MYTDPSNLLFLSFESGVHIFEYIILTPHAQHNIKYHYDTTCKHIPHSHKILQLFIVDCWHAYIAAVIVPWRPLQLYYSPYCTV